VFAVLSKLLRCASSSHHDKRAVRSGSILEMRVTPPWGISQQIDSVYSCKASNAPWCRCYARSIKLLPSTNEFLMPEIQR
jgi:hypothetical protein